jgi:SAM-dependent methyltransferase
MRAKRLTFESSGHPKLTHYVFRYPAKFHPPVARALVESYTCARDTVLDPFCGSGTLLVEALTCGRHSIGVDVDPVAAFVARAKVHPYSIRRLERHAETLKAELAALRRPIKEYEKRQFTDLAVHKYADELGADGLAPPPIPNLRHWFRRYVIVDLCRIRAAIDPLRCNRHHREFFLLVFCSIVRAASNADPVPVSGLEVTRHMMERDAAGRVIDPFGLFFRALERAMNGVRELAARRTQSTVEVVQGNATALSAVVKSKADATITSPPYHNAVDYYRRHTLESYWLGLAKSHEERLVLRKGYLGQAKVRQDDEFLMRDLFAGRVVRSWEARMRKVSAERANAFHHYVNSMHAVFKELAGRLRNGAPAVFVVGHSTWNSSPLPTTTIFRELAEPWFSLRELWWYPISNRYMSYSRRNGANIDREFVLVFERRRQ